MIREGQIAGLGLPAICRPARLIPPHGMGLPGSPIPHHPPPPPVSLYLTSPTLQNIACVPLRHINADIDPHYIVPGSSQKGLTQLWLICISLFLSFDTRGDVEAEGPHRLTLTLSALQSNPAQQLGHSSFKKVNHLQ